MSMDTEKSNCNEGQEEAGMVEEIKRLCGDGAVMWTIHAAERMTERDISKEDVLNAIASGEAIENYPDDCPFPSVLLYGNDIHVVCGLGKGVVTVVTAYRPSLDKWEPDMRTRRRKKQ